MKAASFWLFIVVMATCVVGVGELRTKGRFKWIRDTKRENVTSGDLQELISERRLINLASEYIEQVIDSGQPWRRLSLFCYVVLVMAIALYSPLILVACRPSETMGRHVHSLHSVINSLRRLSDAQEHPSGTFFGNQKSGQVEAFDLSCRIDRSSWVANSLSDERNTPHGQAKDDGTNAEMVIPNIKAPGTSQKPSSESSTLGNVEKNVASERSRIQGEFEEKLVVTKSDSEMIASNEDSSSEYNPTAGQLVEIVYASSESVSEDTQRVPSLKNVANVSNVEKNVASERSRIQGEFEEKLVVTKSDSEMIASNEDSSSEYNPTAGQLVEIVYASSESVSEDTQRVPSESTDEVRMILDGKDPVALGSWIGNCLFINSAKGRDNNKYVEILKDIARYIFCCIFPTLLIFGVGDLSLLLMQYGSSRLADFSNNCFMAAFFTKCRIGGGVTFLIFHLLRSYYARELASKGINVWRSCFVHCNHLPANLRLKCFFNPCGECKNSPPDCSIQVDIPNNIVHNMEKVTENVLKHCSYFAQGAIDYYTENSVKAFGLAILLFFNFIMDVLLSSPIVCSFQPRIWLLKESMQNRFRGPHLDVVWDIVEALYKLFFFSWLVYCSTCDAIHIVNACIGFLVLLSNNYTDELLKHVFAVLVIYIYYFSCYSSFKSFYSKLVEKLCENYKKQYDKIKKTKPNTNLVNYEQGDHTAIEYQLFEFAIHQKTIKEPIRNRVGVLLFKIIYMFLILVVLFPVFLISSPLVPNFFFILSAAFFWFNSRINSTTFNVSEEKLKNIVKNFIKKKK